MAHKNMEGSRDLKDIKTEMFMYKIMYSALEKVIKTNTLENGLKEKLMYLMNPLNQDDLSELITKVNDQLNISSHHSSATVGQPTEMESVDLLGLSSDMMSQLNTVNFTQREILLIQDIFIKELPKFLEELSGSFIEFESPLAPSKSMSTYEESFELAKDINNLVIDNNSEIENNVQLQNNLIELKYKTIPGKELKKIENYENKKLKDILQSARNLHDETLNVIYPSEDCNSKMKEEVCSLKQELLEINNSIDELSGLNELYKKVDINEMMKIVEQYKEIKGKISMAQMTTEEIKPFRS